MIKDTNKKYAPSEEEAMNLLLQIKNKADQSGYNINPDKEFVLMLMNGLLINKERYGYLSCPCRLAGGIAALDNDIICPCDYRDSDLTENEACYCALYVSEKVLQGKVDIGSIPERRPTSEERTNATKSTAHFSHSNLTSFIDGLSYPVWRCKVCGYLCARNEPPEVCPICKVNKERFEKFL